jgi:carboxymethylenebutenolidase
MQDPKNLTPRQQAMCDMWDAHTQAEFKQHSLEHTLATMTAAPFVNHVPVITGGRNLAEVKHFYGTYFIPCQPPDTEITFLNRTVSENRIVDELVHKFTHTIEMPWLLPGVKPTGRRVELAVIVVVQFDEGKIVGERIYWDQASALVQVGLLDPKKVPAWGAEIAHKLVDPQRPSNELIARAERGG